MQFRVLNSKGNYYGVYYPKTVPRKAGKTTFVRKECPGFSYTNLEEPDTRQRAQADPKGFLSSLAKPAILDEIQRLPGLLSYLQVLVDEEGKNGQFVLTGSHQLDLSQAVSQSLAGRTAILTLLPLSLEELGPRLHNLSRSTLMRKGFLPRIHDQAQEPTRAYRNYFQTYVERDLRQLLMVRDLSKFEAFMKILAGRVGQLFVASSVANELGLSYKTIQEWVAILEASFIVFLLHPFHKNYGKRFVKTPKLYFVEPGLACYLLGIETDQQVDRDPLFGGLFENLVVVEALKARFNLGKNPALFFLRDSNGTEIDLVLDRRPGPLLVEIKASSTFQRDFTKNLTRLGTLETEGQQALIYAGREEQTGDKLKIVNYTQTSTLFG